MTDADLWNEVYAHRERLTRIARRRTDSDADAEDVVSEALLRVATFPALDRQRVGEMLTSVTLRLCVDAARHRYVERSVLPRLQEVAPDPVADLLDHAEARWLAEVPLTKVERTLLLARVHGLYPSEVAASLGMTLPAAKHALARARRKMLLAWRATLGVFGLSRLRRLAPAGGVVVVALAAYVLAPPPAVIAVVPAEGTAVAQQPPEGRGRLVPAHSASVALPVGPAPTALPTAPGASRPPHASAAVVRVPVPPLGNAKAGVGAGGVEVDLSEHPVDRIRRCAANGLDIDPRSMSLTCR